MAIGDKVRRYQEEKARKEQADMQDEIPQPAPAVALSFEQLKELLAEAKSSPVDAGEIAAKAAAAAAQAAIDGVEKWKPHEIRQSPKYSVFNPEGDVAHPRPRLKCHMYFGSGEIGDPNDNRTLKREEIEALNTLLPGFYRIEKTDGSRVVVEIRGQLDAQRQVERLWILVPSEDENKNAYPKLTDLCAQCCEANRTQNPLVAA